MDENVKENNRKNRRITARNNNNNKNIILFLEFYRNLKKILHPEQLGSLQTPTGQSTRRQLWSGVVRPIPSKLHICTKRRGGWNQ